MARRLPLGSLRVLRHRDYALVALGNFVSQLGIWARYIGIGWVARGLTDSPILVTVAFGAQFLPNLILSPFGGLVADRFDRRLVTIVGNVGMAIPTVVMAMMIQQERMTISWLIALAFAGGTMQTLSMPASNALIPALVPADELPSAIAVNSALQNVSRFVGAALAGVIIRAFGSAAAFHFNAATFFGVVIAWLVVRPAVPALAVVTEPFVRRLQGGVRFVRGHPGLRKLLPLTVALTTLTLQQPLLPLITDQVLHAGPSTYGLLTSATGLGAIVGALLAGQKSNDEGRRMLMTVGMLSTTASVYGAGLSHWVPLSVVMQVLFGFGLFMTSAIVMTVVMVETPDEFRGRVLGLYQLSQAGMIPVMSLLAGVLGNALGITPALVVAASVQLGCILWFLLSGGLSAVSIEHPVELATVDDLLVIEQ